MQKTEIKILKVEETIYYCDACNKRLGAKDDLTNTTSTQLFTPAMDRDYVIGRTLRVINQSYLLCDECYQALHEYLTTEKSDKKGLSVLLSEES